MENFKFIEIQVLANGIVRLYGNGGLVCEYKGDYVTMKTNVDAMKSNPSGEMPAKK